MATRKRAHPHPERAGHAEITVPIVPQVKEDLAGYAAAAPTAAPTPAPQASASGSIQVRAYTLWEQAGRPEGEGARNQFWFRAETEVAADRAGS
jgi:hypothetical protein